MEGYNGWSNFETWAVALWLNNDYGLYSYVAEKTEEVKARYDKEYDTIDALAYEIENFVRENEPDVFGMYNNLLSQALAKVDWAEIAEAELEG